MSVCNSCIKTPPVARCLTNLIIGTISSLNTSTYVYIRNLTLDDRLIRYSVTSSGTGRITVPITPQRFSEDHSYEIRVVLVPNSTTAPEVDQDITIDGEVSKCVALRFKTIWDNNNVIVTYTNQTLSV